MKAVEIENVIERFAEIEFGFDMYSAAEIQTCNEALSLLKQYAALVKSLGKQFPFAENLPEEIRVQLD